MSTDKPLPATDPKAGPTVDLVPFGEAVPTTNLSDDLALD